MTDTPESYWWYEEYREEYEEFQRHPELIRLFLYAAGISDRLHLSELASAWLAELAEVGLPELDPDREAPLKQADHERPVLDPREGELYPVRIGDHRQMFWLKLDGPRTVVGDKSGYRLIKVLDKPLRTQTAIIALLTALEATPIDEKRLHEALFNEPPLELPIDKGPGMAWWFQNESDDESAKRHRDLQLPKLRYVLSLLRYYRPSFDELPHEEQLGLIKGACERVNKFLEASRQLVGFLEYGEVGGDLREAVKDANRDVKAAVLHDVEGLTSMQIAKRLGIPISDSYKVKNEHKGVVERIKRGKNMLEAALEEEGWQRQIEAMKADAERYRNLSIEEQQIQTLVDDNMPVEEARRKVEEAGRKVDEAGDERLRPAWFVPGDPY